MASLSRATTNTIGHMRDLSKRFLRNGTDTIHNGHRPTMGHSRTLATVLNAPRAGDSFVKYLLLSFPMASFGLGVWQIRRRQWKLDLIDDMDSRLKAEPIELTSIGGLKDLELLEYHRIKVRGRFDFGGRQIYLEPRALVTNDEAMRRGRTAHQSNNGSFVVTPFILDNSNSRILVNRGWLPAKTRETGESIESVYGSKEKIIDLVGILRTTDRRPSYGMKNKQFTDDWQIRDVDALAKALQTAPIFLDADQSLTPGVGPIGGQTQVTIRNEHLNYIITWFGLGICTLLLWYTKYGRRRIRGRGSRW